MRTTARLSLLAVAVASASVAQAQTIEEVVVTAQKRTQNLTDVPISISAVTEEQIDKQNAKRLSDLSNTLPNVNMTQGSDSSARLTIRGVGASSRNIGFDTRVGVYVDGVYMGQSPALNQELAELQQVEVLRGPQGTLFGKNTVAGAVNLITKKPSLEETYGSLSLSAGNMDFTQAKFVVNVPLTETLAVNVSGSTLERDGFTKNIYGSAVPTYPYPPLAPLGTVSDLDDFYYKEGHGGEEYGDRNADVARVQLLWEPNDTFSARLAYDYLDSNQTPVGREPISDSLGNFLDPYSPNSYEINTDAEQYEKRALSGTALTLEYTLPNDHTIKSISAYRDTEAFVTNDLDFGPRDWVNYDYTDHYKQTTQEIQFISPEFDNYNYVVGLYYYNQKSTTGRDVNIGQDIRDLDMFFTEVPASFQLQPGTTVANNGKVETESYALFANGSYSFTDKHQITVGFRWETEQKTVNWDIDGTAAMFLVGTASDQACANPIYGFYPEQYRPICSINDDRRDTNFAPTIAYNYFITDEHTFYARIAQGYKSGGYNLDYNSQSTLNNGVEFDEESVISYEIGFKGQAFDRLKYGIAAFRADYDDYQVSQIIELKDENGLPIGTSYSIENAAKVETYGLELEGTFFVTEGLSISANYGWLDAKFDSFPGGGPNGEDLAGNVLPRAPEQTASISFDYTTSMGAFDIYAHVDYSYTDDVYTTEDNVDSTFLLESLVNMVPKEVPYGTIKGYGIGNANIGFSTGEGRYNLSLWVKNFTDEEYQIDTGEEFLGTVVQSLNVPRTYGVTFKLAY